MTTKIKRTKDALDVAATFTQHLTLKADAKRITTRSEALKKRLKDFLLARQGDVYASETGSLFYDLPETVEVDGTEYSGMELRRSVTTKFDEDVAEAILKKKGVYEEALTPVIDQDKVLRLQQEGKITEKDIDKMFVAGEQFAFWPVKGEVL